MNQEELASLANCMYIEHLYSQYLKTGEGLDPSWPPFFDAIERKTPSKKSLNLFDEETPLLQYKILRLIEAYQRFGYKGAQSNPLLTSSNCPDRVEQLQIETWGFQQKELDAPFPTCGVLKEAETSLKTLIDALKKKYCGTVGFEFMHIQSQPLIAFIQNAIQQQFDIPFTQEEKIDLFQALSEAELLELFLHKKYPGQKRFSLEGGEALIPMLRRLIRAGASMGVEEIVLGMAHRGRLNVLVNALGKSCAALFQEFERGFLPEHFKGSGDVKYHQGYCAHLSTPSGKEVNVFLCPNPSHLEAVDGVVQGYARARQKSKKAKEKGAILPLLIHGDAAFSGQGVVYETFQLSKLEGYQTGGTIHIVVNNQLGFTASKEETQSTSECTDLGKAFGIPIFHVNGEDPEKGIKVIELALDIRQKFGSDVLIELNCYRKHGHNESDEPTFTNPTLYRCIQNRQSVRTLYLKELIAEGTLSENGGKEVEREIQNRLERPPLSAQKTNESRKPPSHLPTAQTSISQNALLFLAQRCTTLPEGLNIHPKLKKLFKVRLDMVTGNQETIDWGMGECLAYAALLTQGVDVRLSGQDSGRGTFSHRHALLIDQETGVRDSPLFHLKEGQSLFEVYNSPLIEYAVMGFEYGYSVADPKGLTVWEGQFGDFANGAQIIIDQFLASGREKWNARSSLTLLLPHGYEGQGPEHSSARIERFLQLAANDSLRVVIPTTPAQLFHILRGQGLSQIQTPLILFTPKALLRYPPSFSPPGAFTTGTFQTVIEDPSDPQKAVRLIFCSGKVYYDLKERNKRETVAIIRIEQLYPLDKKGLKNVIKKYPPKTEWVWVQEEPKNMGAYSSIRPTLEKLLPEKSALRYVGRKRSASPSAGSEKLHREELESFLQEALET